MKEIHIPWNKGRKCSEEEVNKWYPREI